MPLSRKHNLLAQWVALKHRGQLIRRSGKPYFDHLSAVAEIAASFTHFGYEIGLCHDLLEKTGTTAADLILSLLRFGYCSDEAAYITGVVIELTDVYHKSAYPKLPKKERKEKEATRLVNISAGAQTVKYADLGDNIRWMLQYNRPGAAAYLERKNDLIIKMNAGDPLLRQQVFDLIQKSIKDLST